MLRQFGCEAGFVDDSNRLGITEDIGDLRLAQPRPDRHEDRAKSGDGQNCDDRLDAVVQHHRNAIVGAHTARLQPRRDAIDTRVEFAVVNADAAVDHCFGVGGASNCLTEHPVDGWRPINVAAHQAAPVVLHSRFRHRSPSSRCAADEEVDASRIIGVVIAGCRMACVRQPKPGSLLIVGRVGRSGTARQSSSQIGLFRASLIPACLRLWFSPPLVC